MNDTIFLFKYNNLTKSIVINDIIQNTTFLEIFITLFNKKDINNYKHQYFFTTGTCLINPDTLLHELINNISKTSSTKVTQSTQFQSPKTTQSKFHIIECFDVIKGGDVLDTIFKAIFGIFDPIVKPIVGIGEVFIFIFQLLIWLIKFIYWFVFFVAWLFMDLLNPVKLVTDFWGSIILIIVTFFSTIVQLFMGIIGFGVNGVGSWLQGFFGWDQSNLTKNDRESNYFRQMDRNKGKKCYLTNTNTVPFSILLGTILCPPIGVFMDMGATGWFNIFICMILTMLFYVPGLLYALLIIYS